MNEKKFFLVSSVTTVTTVITVITVTTFTTVITVTTVTSIVVKYQMVLLYSSKGNFFTKVLWQTTDRPTGRPTNNYTSRAAQSSKKCSEKVPKTRICPTSLEYSVDKTSHPTKHLRPRFNHQFCLGLIFCIDFETPGYIEICLKVAIFRLRIFLLLSEAKWTGLWRRRPTTELSARWRTGASIKNLRAHLIVSFVSASFFD